MNIPTEVYGLIARYLHNAPRTQLRLALVCHAAYKGVIRFSLGSMNVGVNVVYNEGNTRIDVPVRTGSRYASIIMPLALSGGYCDVTMGNLCIRVRRYGDHCLISMLEDDRCYHEYRAHSDSQTNTATTWFIEWAAPGVIPVMLLPYTICPNGAHMYTLQPTHGGITPRT